MSPTRHLSLQIELESFIGAQISIGLFANAEEVRSALRQLLDSNDESTVPLLQTDIPSKVIEPSELMADIEAIKRIEAIPTILEVVCHATGMGFAAIARVTDDRWIACQVLDTIDFGLASGGELKVETTICHEIRQSRETVVIDNVAEDPRYCAHHTPAMYGFQSYISVPIIRKNGTFFGTLCAIDPRPARLKTPGTIGMFRLFAELIASHLDNDEDLLASRAALQEEQYLSELREQFIAVLGHDLRNPLTSIAACARFLFKNPSVEQQKLLLTTIQGSVVRMAGLIDNVLDLARGRLGTGIPLSRQDVLLTPVLKQVVTELHLGAPDRLIETDIDLPAPINCDPSRIGQLVSNLLGNALTHGSATDPVRVRVTSRGETLTISVANGGEPIPSSAMARLFQPFYRGEGQDSQGLGLGLHIASEIAKAHGGLLNVTSTSAETCFTFEMPLNAGEEAKI